MNSFAHALPYLDQPYVAVGSCVPDLLSAVDRRCRARRKKAVLWVEDTDATLAATARGVVHHHDDDGWFHRSEIFQRLNLKFAVEFREQFERGHSMRPSLIAHIVIEMMLDHYLEKQLPGSLEQFYQVVQEVDSAQVQRAINRFASQPTARLVPAIERFLDERFLFDYRTEAGIRYRMNRVLERVGLLPMPEAVLPWLAEMRREVETHAGQLLQGLALDPKPGWLAGL